MTKQEVLEKLISQYSLCIENFKTIEDEDVFDCMYAYHTQLCISQCMAYSCAGSSKEMLEHVNLLCPLFEQYYDKGTFYCGPQPYFCKTKEEALPLLQYRLDILNEIYNDYKSAPKEG